jgi:hypothetical protein
MHKGQIEGDHQHGQDAGRHVHIEHPAPAQGIGDPAAQGRVKERAEAVDGAEQPLDARQPLRGKDIGQNGKDGDQEDAASSI